MVTATVNLIYYISYCMCIRCIIPAPVYAAYKPAEPVSNILRCHVSAKFRGG